MISGVKDVLLSRLDDLDWIKPDQETLRRVKYKIGNMTAHVGYPEMVANATALKEFYENFQVNPEEFLLNEVGSFGFG